MVLPLDCEACEPVNFGVWKPLNNLCENWKAESVEARAAADGAVEVAVKGSSKEADGGYVIRLDAAGGIKISYDFSSNIKEDPRQWGMALFAPKQLATLHWSREAQWSFYPAGHIGRPIGTAVARVASSGQPCAMEKPALAWRLDATELGGNDFSSTKVAIRQASLADGSSKLCVISDGHQSVRAFMDGDQAGLLVAGFHSGGGDDSFNMHFTKERRWLDPGTRLSDTIQLRLAGP